LVKGRPLLLGRCETLNLGEHESQLTSQRSNSRGRRPLALDLGREHVAEDP
jgi:hypothetical protein